MRQFPLMVGNGILTLDTNGSVHDPAGNKVGDWTTEGHLIKIRRALGGSDLVDVEWAFNARNQLTIVQGGQLIFTMLNSTDGLPGFHLDGNQLVVDPDGDRDFTFTLACAWGLDGDGNLVMSVNGKESVIDGFIEDTKSRLRFQFDDKDTATFPNSLVFAGQWERVDTATHEIRLHFVLDDPKLEIAGKPLTLPAAVRVDPMRNHLALVYESRSNGTHRLQFMGSFEIRPDFTLNFRIDDVKDSGLRKSRIEVQTTFAFDVVRGNLQLFVGRERTAQSQVLEVGGALSAKLKNGQLDWTFAYRKATSGGQSSVTVATALSFVAKDQSILVKYSQNGTTRQLDVTAKFAASDFVAAGGLSIVNDAQGRAVRAFVGVSF